MDQFAASFKMLLCFASDACNRVYNEASGKMEDGSRPLDKGLVTKFRALTARANYLAADRPDIQYAAKE